MPSLVRDADGRPLITSSRAMGLNRSVPIKAKKHPPITLLREQFSHPKHSGGVHPYPRHEGVMAFSSFAPIFRTHPRRDKGPRFSIGITTIEMLLWILSFVIHREYS